MKHAKKVVFLMFLLSFGAFAYTHSVQLDDTDHRMNTSQTFGLASDFEWSDTVLVSDTSDQAVGQPLVVLSSSAAHIVWVDYSDYDGEGTDADVFYRTYDLDSGTFSTPEVLSDDDGAVVSRYPDVAIDENDDIHVVWQQDDDIQYRFLDVSSGTWSSVETPVTGEDSGEPRIDVDGSANVHLVWTENNDGVLPGDSDLYGDIGYSMRSSSSGTWSSFELVSSTSSNSAYAPDIAVAGNGDMYVVWMDTTNYDGSGGDTDIFIRKYLGSSDAWDDVDVISETSDDESRKPRVDVDSDHRAWIVWEDSSTYGDVGSDSDIWYCRYDSSPLPDIVTEESSVDSLEPYLAVCDDDNLHITWNEVLVGSGSDKDIAYMCGDQEPVELGFTMGWERFCNVSEDSGGISITSSLALGSDDSLCVVWIDYGEMLESGSDSDIFLRVYSEETTSTTTSPSSTGPTTPTSSSLVDQLLSLFGEYTLVYYGIAAVAVIALIVVVRRR